MHLLTATNSVVNHFLAELRAIDIQHDSMRFRRNMERIGEVMAYEISKTFKFSPVNISTPLGMSLVNMMDEQPLLATVLRAGLPFHQGFLNYFDKAESAFIAAYRDISEADHSFKIKMDYVATPSPEGKTMIVIDPMLATGKSLVKTYEVMLTQGTPLEVHIAAVIASRKGIEYIQEKIPKASLWVGAVDEGLNNKSYIIPGLGDAGDLAFGAKR